MAPAWYPAEVKHLPAPIRVALRQQCGGDWSRVTVDGRGSITVHNRPQVGGLQRAVKKAPAKKPPPGPRPAPPSAPLRRVAVPEARERPEPIPMPVRAEPALVEAPPLPPSKPKTAPPQPKRELKPASVVLDKPTDWERPDRETRWVLLPGIETELDWDGGDLEGNAWRLCQRVSTGLGDVAPLAFHDDVTALHGLDLEQVESVVRHADRVVVDGSTGWKKYPILKFYRADNMVVVGFRHPVLPKILAAYFKGAMATPDAKEKTGGGGSRKTSGLPNTPAKLIRALRQYGACVAEPQLSDKVVQVTFHGKDVGKVPVEETTPRKDIESAYQRTIRRCQAITERERAGKAG